MNRGTKQAFNLADWLRGNAVMLTFVILSVTSVIFSGMRLTALFNVLSTRIFRNAFLILALILPIVAGMGINFAITIGAMGAQIALLLVLNWKIPGALGLFIAAVMTIPFAGAFGYLVGKLLNRMKGQEMIGSMILGYFANGLYQVLFLFVFGRLIPMANSDLIVLSGSSDIKGISNTLDLSRGSYAVKYGIEKLWKLTVGDALYICAGALAVFLVTVWIIKKKPSKPLLVAVIIMAAACGAYQAPIVSQQFMMVRIPMVTLILIALLSVFNVVIMKTKLGQRFRAVGQSQTVANAAGINVNQVRLIAIVLSTIFAGWGQLISMQSLGIMQTYAAHESIGLYAGAAILVGGATTARATNGQAILGCVLFHMLFATANDFGTNVFGNAAIGEFFRVFVSYGVIAVALVMHGWKMHQRRKPGAELI